MPGYAGQQLVDQSRERAGYQSSNFVTDAEVLGLVNEECIALRDLIISSEESYYSTPYVFTLPDPVLAAACTAASLPAPPPNYAALPDDFDRAQGLDLGNGQGPFTLGGGPAGMRPTTVHEFAFQQRNDMQGPRYKIWGRLASKDLLIVEPEENSAGNYRLWMVPQFTPLTLVTTLDATMQRFNRYVSMGAAARILRKAKRDATGLLQDQAVVAQAVQTMSNNRDSEAEQGATDGQSGQRWPYYWGR